MPRSGNTYSRPAGQPVSAGTTIDATVFNNLTADIASELTRSWTNDGTGTPTANIPMNNFRFTGLGNGSLAGDSATLGQVQGGGTTWLSGVAGTNTVTGNASPAVTAYSAGQTFSFVPAATNTGAATLQINGAGTAQQVFAFGVACAGGELIAGVPVTVVHDGTRFNIVNPQTVPIRLNRTVASGASSVQWGSSILATATYDRWWVVVSDVVLSTTADIQMQFSTDNGSTWIAGTSNVYARAGGTSAQNGLNSAIVASSGDSRILLSTGVTNTSRFAGDFYIDLSSWSSVRGIYTVLVAGSQAYQTVFGAVNSAANAFRILPSTGTISGNFSIYGLRK